MKELFRVRKKHGSVFATVFNENLVIPWKLLSLQDYIKYLGDYKRSLIPSVCLENEIFIKCVLDDSIVRQINFLNAGTVSTVVQNIWQYSGPSDVNKFNQDLAVARSHLENEDTKIFHELVQLITTAFPYKPEEVYAMDYDLFMFRLVQSEKKLMEMGILKSPLELEDKSNNQVSEARNKVLQNYLDRKVNAKQLWEAENQPTPRMSQDKKWWKKSPVLESKQKHNINFSDNEIVSGDSHAIADGIIHRAKMVEDAQWIYKDLIEELERKHQK